MKITRRQLRQIIQEQILLTEKSHTVEVGDTMHGIAKKYNVSIGSLLSKNRQFDQGKLGDWKRGDRPDPATDKPGASSGRNPNWIYPGEVLQIPTGGGQSGARPPAASVKADVSPGAGAAPPVDDGVTLAQAVKSNKKPDPCDKLRQQVSQELAPLKGVLSDFDSRFQELNSKKVKTGRRLRIQMLKDIDEKELKAIRDIVEKLEELGIDIDEASASGDGNTSGKKVTDT
jgi:LysM repeat protein